MRLAGEEDQHIEVPHSPLKLNPDDFAILADGDPEEYAQELPRDVFAVEKVREFLLTVAPLPIRGGTGSPVNPIATF